MRLSTVDNPLSLLDIAASVGRFSENGSVPTRPTPYPSRLIHMSVLILASSSATRAKLLRNAGLEIEVRPARIDEENIRRSLLAEGASTADLADALAENKALRVAQKHPQGLVLGCDQILDLDGAVLAKPDDENDARSQLRRLRAKTHRLFSAAVLYDQGQPVWRKTAIARLTMRPFSDDFLESYLSENWQDIRHCVGCYQIEGPGIRLFSSIEGDFFGILGLPLLDLLTFLTHRKSIPG